MDFEPSERFKEVIDDFILRSEADSLVREGIRNYDLLSRKIGETFYMTVYRDITHLLAENPGIFAYKETDYTLQYIFCNT